MSKTLHISHIEDSLMQRMELLARKERTSVEDFVHHYLAKLIETDNISPSNGKRKDKNSLIADLSGAWSSVDLAQFENNTAPFREIDASLWK